MTPEQEELLDEALEIESGLPDKAIRFIEDINRKRHYSLSPKQDEWLRAIVERSKNPPKPEDADDL